MTKTTTNDTQLCQEYLQNYLEKVKEQLNQCQSELSTQSQSCPITSLTLNQIDDRLKEYVHAERKYLLARSNEELKKFEENISGKDLHETMVGYGLSMNSVSVSKSFYTHIWKVDRFFASKKSFPYFLFVFCYF